MRAGVAKGQLKQEPHAAATLAWAKRSAMLATALLATATLAGSLPAKGPCYHGVNLSGAEYGERDGILGTNYTYPSEATVEYFAAKGMTVIRLPFRWERLQPVLNAPLDSNELESLKASVELIRNHGMAVVLDPHNFGFYDKKKIQEMPGGDIAFGDFWARIALEFGNREGVIFGLMNEPHDIKAPDWLKVANTAIIAIRAMDANNLVLVPGTNWSGAWTWEVDRLGGGSNASIMRGIKDPANNYAYEFHQYLDADSSGTHSTCEGAEQARQGLVRVTDWLRKSGKRGFLGEFGAASSEPCLAGLRQMMEVMTRNGDVWLGWTYWSGGEWWPPDEPFNVQPGKGRDKPQLKLIEGMGRKLPPPEACNMANG